MRVTGTNFPNCDILREADALTFQHCTVRDLIPRKLNIADYVSRRNFSHIQECRSDRATLPLNVGREDNNGRLSGADKFTCQPIRLSRLVRVERHDNQGGDFKVKSRFLNIRFDSIKKPFFLLHDALPYSMPRRALVGRFSNMHHGASRSVSTAIAQYTSRYA